MYLTTDIISYAKISQALAAMDIAKNSALGSNSVAENLPEILYDVRKSVDWQNTANGLEPTLFQTSNYLYGLCGKYAFKAADLKGNAVGGMVVGTTQVNVPLGGIVSKFFAGTALNASNQYIDAYYKGYNVIVELLGFRKFTPAEITNDYNGTIGILIGGPYTAADTFLITPNGLK